ncbi:MAG TPA: ABC transporter ATP-binding protein [Gemmataceae bacterium]|nr:ABC transporter ATP-binding protein [Gemmataceae bacterium]
MSDPSPAAVEVRGLTKVFGTGLAQVEALRGIELRLAPGEFVAVTGPSGSGKSTLLHLIGGLDVPTAGKIWIGGDELGSLDDDQLTRLRRRRLGFIFQAFNLLDTLSAVENVALPLLIDGLAEREAQQRARAALEWVDLSMRKNHVPGQLSGGEQQRVAIARALVTHPLLLLADEPTGNLDTANSDQVMMLLRTLVDERGQTILMVTHNVRHAALADRLLRLRDGRIVEQQSLPRSRSVEKVLEDLESLS